jgi:hypothetical protein
MLAKMTSKNQLTLPKTVTDALGVPELSASDVDDAVTWARQRGMK